MVILADAPGAFFPPILNSQVVKLLSGVCTLREELWKEVHYEGELKKLDDLIDRFQIATTCPSACHTSLLTCSVLLKFKGLFAAVGENCTFPKFHATLHYTSFIRRFGSLRFLDSGVGERQHKVI
jgi:hypothetical protein